MMKMVIFHKLNNKQFCEGLMNEHTQPGETRNYFLSLKERRDVAQNLQLDDDAVCDMVHRASDDKITTEMAETGKKITQKSNK